MIKVVLLALLVLVTAEVRKLYIGTWSKYIYILDFDTATGSLKLASKVDVGNRPSYVSIDPTNTILYTVNEVTEYLHLNETGGVLSYRIANDGSLGAMSTLQSYGSSPCFLDVSRDGKFLLSANYDGSTFAVFGLDQGKITNATFVKENHGHGPNPDRQGAPHPHQFIFDPANKFAFVCDLGLDKIFQFIFDAQLGRMIPNPLAPFIESQPGSGPRHIAFHPRLPKVYLTHELSSTISTLKYNSSRGVMSYEQTQTMVPKGVDPTKCYGAEVLVSPDGLFVYASNRGASNTIVIFKVNQNNGTLTNIGFQESFGEFPRFIMLDETGKWLIVPNQNSDNVVVFARNQITGMLQKVAQLNGISIPTAAALLKLK
jgi:6-phosphogluconolactonase